DPRVVASQEVGVDRLVSKQVRRIAIRKWLDVVRRLDAPEVTPVIADPGHFRDGAESDVPLERDVALIILFRLQLPLGQLLAVQGQRETGREVSSRWGFDALPAAAAEL